LAGSASSSAVFAALARSTIRRRGLSGDFEWYTWSATFRKLIAELLPFITAAGEPDLVQLPGLQDYAWTFSLSPDKMPSRRIQEKLHAAAAALAATTLPKGLVMLDALFDKDLGGREIRVLLALLRSALVDKFGPHAALYPPLGTTGPSVGGFALHADMYVPEMLLNVFDDVSPDDSGASLFLPVSALPAILAAIPDLPVRDRNRILALLKSVNNDDRFGELYDLLHGKHAWKARLEELFAANEVRLKLRRGQGYMVHDRRWLHGRDAPSHGVPEFRLHRLAFMGRRQLELSVRGASETT
jgi:hypothetical protein